MKKIRELRRHLDTLTAGGTDRASPAADLAACRALQERLQALKLEVLEQLAAARREGYERTRESLRSGTDLGLPAAGDSAERRVAGAKQLLADVGQRVKGLLDDHGTGTVQKWSEIHREIDDHLRRLAQLEVRLAGDAGEDVADTLRAPRRRPQAGADDELYGLVGAAVQQGKSAAAFCPHCGQGVDPGDRFCRRCGHRQP